MKDPSDLMAALLAAGIVAAAIYGFIWMIRTMRQSGARGFDLCDECGYDMQATPERCPECGWRRPKPSLEPGRIDVNKLIETAPHDYVNVRVPGADEHQVVVFETDASIDADTICEHLEARGIACETVARESRVQRGARVFRDTYFQVVVWSKDEHDAAALVALARVTAPASDVPADYAEN